MSDVARSFSGLSVVLLVADDAGSDDESSPPRAKKPRVGVSKLGGQSIVGLADEGNIKQLAVFVAILSNATPVLRKTGSWPDVV